jgi:hypothetical protein
MSGRNNPIQEFPNGKRSKSRPAVWWAATGGESFGAATTAQRRTPGEGQKDEGENERKRMNTI